MQRVTIMKCNFGHISLFISLLINFFLPQFLETTGEMLPNNTKNPAFSWVINDFNGSPKPHLILSTSVKSDTFSPLLILAIVDSENFKATGIRSRDQRFPAVFLAYFKCSFPW
jgi:hypothetical protein